jgi:alpha-D-ribose 1-methylphosphonate 5-triphosphate synthase subunit PhnH
MKNEHDIERSNRENYRSILRAISRPGEIQPVIPLFGSGLLAMASVLLYAEVSYYGDPSLDFQLIRALCGPRCVAQQEADYLFFADPHHDHLHRAKVGTAESPEFGATLLFGCEGLGAGWGTTVLLSGPGIDGRSRCVLPVSETFIAALQEKNSSFPMGIDLFFVGKDNRLFGLPRTTRIEVIA